MRSRFRSIRWCTVELEIMNNAMEKTIVVQIAGKRMRVRILFDRCMVRDPLPPSNGIDAAFFFHMNILAVLGETKEKPLELF
jgi:hypothetical protein